MPADIRKVDITVALCTFNRSSRLSDAVVSLLEQETDGFSYEILVIDNASTDDTGVIVARLTATTDVAIRMVSEPRPGLAFARNCGVRHARGDWIAIFDDDQIAEPNWLREMWKVAKGHDADVVTGVRKLMPPEPATSRDQDTLSMSSLSPLCRGVLGENFVTNQVRPLREGEYACDGNIMRHRRVHEKLGPFDEDMSRGGQDDRFSRKTVNAGFHIWYAPGAIVHHRLTEQMLTEDYFRWKSRRVGSIFALHDYHFGGKARVVVNCMLRLVQALGLMIPRILVARLRGNRQDALTACCKVWRSQGFFWQTLAVAAPNFFGEESLSVLDFRKGRRAGEQSTD